jgi:hypothetical protein
MKINLHRRLLAIGLSAGLIAAVIGSYCWMDASRATAAAATENLNACLRVASQIKSLRKKPLRAGAEARSATELARLIETSAQKASLPMTSVVQIDPQPARRVGNTAYKEQATRLELRDVTLKQLVVLLHSLADEELGTELAELRLNAPREEASASNHEENWSAEMTLTHLIFTP